MMIQKHITISEEQDKYIREHDIKLSQLVRKLLDKEFNL